MRANLDSRWWSSSASTYGTNDTTSAFAMYFDNSDIAISYNYARWYGFPLRCLAD